MIILKNILNTIMNTEKKTISALEEPNKRCPTGNKKINITNRFNCKCDKYYCTEHRYPESHSCEKLKVYKDESIKRLEEQLVKVVGNKLIHI